MGTQQSISGFVYSIPDNLGGKYLTFKLGREDYGLSLLRVQEIIGMVEITSVPRTPAFVLGVLNLRGKVLPVVDLRLKFGMAYREPDPRTCIVVVDVPRAVGPQIVGVVVDQVSEVTDLKAQEIEPSPSFGAGMDTGFILGMAKVEGGS